MRAGEDEAAGVAVEDAGAKDDAVRGCERVLFEFVSPDHPGRRAYGAGLGHWLVAGLADDADAAHVEERAGACGGEHRGHGCALDVCGGVHVVDGGAAKAACRTLSTPASAALIVSGRCIDASIGSTPARCNRSAASAVRAVPRT